MGITDLFRKPERKHPCPCDLLANEALVRQNALFLRGYCRKILEDRNLLLAPLTYDFHIGISEGEMRKDGITPSEQHEQLHIVLADALLKSEKNRLGWDVKKYGGEEALFIAILLHDDIEDRGLTDANLLRFLKDSVEDLIQKKKVGASRRQTLYEEAEHAVRKVCSLSRNWPGGDGNRISRGDYMFRLTEDPATTLIKMIDWANKEATMIGVEHFEKNDREKMRKNIEETDEYFGDVRQHLPRIVAGRHPGIKKKVDKLDAIMAVLHHSLKGYVFAAGQEQSARRQHPYNFSHYVGPAKSVLRHVPDGVNLVKIQMNRIMQAGERDPSIRNYYNQTLAPAVAALMAPAPFWSITGRFNNAATCVNTKLEALLGRPQRIL